MTKRGKNNFIRRVISLSVLIVVLLTIVSFADSKFRITSDAKDIDYMSQHEKYEVVILTGDTSWDIQTKLTPGEDISYNLFLDQQLNSRKDMGSIRVGDIIVFLKKK